MNKQEPQFYSIYDDLERAEIKFNDGKAMFATIRKRRIGKSTSTLKLMEDNWEQSNYQNKCLYIRNTQEELKTFARTFNVKFANRYLMQATHIYKIFVDPVTEKEIKSKRIIVGMVGSLSAFAKLKSVMENTNFNLVIYDEFNGIDGAQALEAQNFHRMLPKNQYFSLLELISSIEGDSKNLLVILIGNKVNSQNDILLCWGIEIPQTSPDYYQLSIRDKQMDGTKYKIRFINGGNKEYEDLHKGNQLFKALSTFDKPCERYFANNDFYQKQDKNVISRLKMEPLNGEKAYLGLGENLICLKEVEDKIYIYEEWEDKENIEVYPLDFKAFLHFENAIDWGEEDQIEWGRNLSDAIKEKKVYFASNWLKHNISFWLERKVKYGII